MKSKGNLLKEFNNYGPYYKVEFDITVNTYPGNCEVFHFTANDNDCCNQGDRYPMLYCNSQPAFWLTSSLNSNANYGKNYFYDVGTKYHIVIEQCLENGQLVYKIIVNDEVFVTEVNSNPLTFDSVKLYAAGAWHTACNDENISLENLKVSTC